MVVMRPAGAIMLVVHARMPTMRRMVPIHAAMHGVSVIVAAAWLNRLCISVVLIESVISGIPPRNGHYAASGHEDQAQPRQAE